MTAKKITDSRNDGSFTDFTDTGKGDDRPSVDQIGADVHFSVGGCRAVETDINNVPLPRDPHAPAMPEPEDRRPDSRFDAGKIMADTSSRAGHDALQDSKKT
jgi:hypothetical protein